ncbi:gamma-glutamyl-gamma-aminobutyrate hydrolase family protein [Bdellovibrio sp. SKB1291214]|uniref:gamma-glutamyl-gamma-aminobutyrate hydrolase family protein n=1 Tax=Bdellovibrio sp. SKB1291214 TaxID=1732569 RepID=UPI0022403B52|nr:gamma-glutamyl-gamma-aminobutyrate hydrolase family protein [Bdellovibrio sp. SKB1291214]UYL08026.1 gamma-glutamyl-gamma-aminobutyrate hydrolase family protein [Bdellovibrio sp. SKB1291214]
MGKLRLIFTILLSTMILTTVAHAAAEVTLYQWLPSGQMAAPFILPVKAGEKPEAAAERYLSNLEKHPDLMELFQGKRPDMRIENLTPLDADRDNRTLLIANLPKDYGMNSQRVNSFKRIFAQAGQVSYILPINANLGLTLAETRSLFDKISINFSMMVAMGGDDVDPAFYKKENLHARNTVPTRDQFEIALIKNYVASEKGFFMGVCRGSQIASVALGYTLLQDVPVQVGPELPHADDWHDIKVKKTTHGILASLLSEGSSTLTVNSLHHQAVKFKAGGPLELAATAADGVTEATEFKNGRGILLQFHPELMDNDLGNKILWRIVQQKAKVAPSSCSKVF